MVLLEALGYGVPVLASDIAANLEFDLDGDAYFRMGNVADLEEKIIALSSRPFGQDQRQAQRVWVRSRFDWRDIAQKTWNAYTRVLQG